MFGTAHDSSNPTGGRDIHRSDRSDTRAGHFAGARILIVGCGDVGGRLIAHLNGRFRVHAVTHSMERVDALRRAGVVPIVADLDDVRSLHRLGGIAPTVIHLAPPPGAGIVDTRTRSLLRSLHGVERMIYISTSGVYGDCHDALIDETRAVAPQTDRAHRRVDAERQLRLWARIRQVRLTILRVPGIYAQDRLPTTRIAAGTPVLQASEDVYTNHIHADDLARLIALTIHRGAAQRVYHAVDESAMRMGDWFDLLADAHRMPRPERVSREAIEARIAPNLLSFMAESRLLSNRRMRDELGMHLTYPTVREGVAAALAER
jgi:nucleoside-diphosphate-sugar epimerase